MKEIAPQPLVPPPPLVMYTVIAYHIHYNVYCAAPLSASPWS